MNLDDIGRKIIEAVSTIEEGLLETAPEGVTPYGVDITWTDGLREYECRFIVGGDIQALYGSQGGNKIGRLIQRRAQAK